VKDDGGTLSSVPGLISALDATQLTLEVNGQAQSLPRAKVFGIVVAQPAAARGPARCSAIFHDGTALAGDSLSLIGDVAQLALSGGAQIDCSWARVSRVLIRSPRVAYLSDLKPIAEEQRPIVTLPLPALRDRNASGKPLQLGSRTFEKGLGVHSRSLLTFAAEKKWDTLAATIGLDPVSGRKGDCEFVVRADNQELLRRRMRGSDPSEEIKLSIAGVERVTLIVEPGEGLDLADHANWCDVRFVRKPAAGSLESGVRSQ
jgi:hypothetical protein